MVMEQFFTFMALIIITIVLVSLQYNGNQHMTAGGIADRFANVGLKEGSTSAHELVKEVKSLPSGDPLMLHYVGMTSASVETRTGFVDISQGLKILRLLLNIATISVVLATLQSCLMRAAGGE